VTAWFDPTLLATCGGDATSQAAAAELASDILSAASGGRFGQQAVVVRPNVCENQCGCGIGYGVGAGFSRLAAAWNGGLVNGCACDVTRLPLPGFIAAVTEVRIDNVVLAATKYDIYENAWLQRTDGYGWPCCQALSLEAGQVGTFTVSYTAGRPVPAAGADAARQLGCELLKASLGVECALPSGVTTVTRDGVAFTLLTPDDLLTNGRTGIVAVDQWLNSVNPGALRSSPVARNPEEAVARRVTG
jgi:hypothetical protein